MPKKYGFVSVRLLFVFFASIVCLVSVRNTYLCNRKVAIHVSISANCNIKRRNGNLDEATVVINVRIKVEN